MKKLKQLLSVFLSVVMLSQLSVLSVFAEEQIDDNISQNIDSTSVQSTVDLGINYLEFNRDEYGVWNNLNDCAAANVINIIEYLNSFGIQEEKATDIIDGSVDFFEMMYCENVNDLSCFMLINALHTDADISYLRCIQNTDGGFGLAEGYTSDIIDTKLALKALTDIGETEAMTNAALYISSLQNEDGGFSYQQELSSNAYLTADIANILVDTVDVNPVLSYYLEDTFIAIDSYLDTAFPAINALSASDLDTVYISTSIQLCTG